MCCELICACSEAWGSGEGLGSPGAVVIGSCEPYHVFAGMELNSGPLWKQQRFLTAEPSLSSANPTPSLFFLFFSDLNGVVQRSNPDHPGNRCVGGTSLHSFPARKATSGKVVHLALESGSLFSQHLPRLG